MRIITVAIFVTLLSAGLSLASEQAFQRGQDAYDRGNYQLAEEIWREQAELGDTASMFALGALLYEGPAELEVNYNESSEWYLKAAQKGHPAAQYNLGNAYQKGVGVPQDDKQAAYWWQRAAAQGMSKAAYNLGVQYMYGRGVPMDYEEALKIFQFAAARGHVAAQKLLRAWSIPPSEGMGVSEPGELTLASSEPNAGSMDEQAGSDTQIPLADREDAEHMVSDATRLTAAEADQQVRDVASDSALADRSAAEAGELAAIAAEPSDPAIEPGMVVMAEAASQIGVVEAEPKMPDQTIPGPGEIITSPAQPVSREIEPVAIAVAEVERQIDTHEAGADAAEQLKDYYTLQLAVMSQPAGVDRFIEQYQLNGDLYGYEMVRGSRTLYGLTIGKFNTREQANALRDQLQRANRDQPGWQKPILSRFVLRGPGEMTSIATRSEPSETGPGQIAIADVSRQESTAAAEPERLEQAEPGPATGLTVKQESSFDFLSPVTAPGAEGPEQSQGRYTLQLAVMSQPGGVDKFIRQYQLSGALYGYRLQRGSKTLYGLTIGRFNTREDANRFRDQLEQGRDSQRGWQKPFLTRFIGDGPEEMTAIVAYPSSEQYAPRPVVKTDATRQPSAVEIDQPSPAQPVDPAATSVTGKRESGVNVPPPDSAPEASVPEASRDRFTLQLAVMSKPAGVDNFIRQYQLSGDLYRFRLVRGSGTLYGLSIGRFDSREEAIAFRNQLHLDMRTQRGWQMPRLRSFVDQGPEEMTAIHAEPVSARKQPDTRVQADSSGQSFAEHPLAAEKATSPIGMAGSSFPTDSVISSESRILGLPEDRYTLQLAVMSQPEGVDKFIQRYQLNGDFYRYRLMRGPRTLYGVSIGNFNTTEDATAFRMRLEAGIINRSGWQTPALRSFLNLQDEIRKAQISDF